MTKNENLWHEFSRLAVLGIIIADFQLRKTNIFVTNIFACCTTEQILIPSKMGKYNRPHCIHRLMLKIIFCFQKVQKKKIGKGSPGAIVHRVLVSPPNVHTKRVKCN